MTESLASYVSALATTATPPAVMQMADFLRTRHPGIRAIICYGSALRDSTPQDTLIDFYLLTESIDEIPGGWLARKLCEHVPPNVYYAECTSGDETFRAKYAMLPLSILQDKVSAAHANPYFWARFAQPMRLVWSESKVSRDAVLAVFCDAMATAKANAEALAPHATQGVTETWTALFEKTYSTELRPESKGRAKMIVETQSDHFETVSRLARPVIVATTSWTWRKWHGKWLSVLRLVKAAFTFQGGADYAAWKIKRHSGVTIEITDWHRRHPVLASVVLLPKLLRKGALK